jgi:hypothetical protein
MPEVAMTYGEVAPQIYRSKQTSPAVAWSIVFKGHRHVVAQGSLAAGRNAVQRNKHATTGANGSANMRVMATGFNYLMLYVPMTDFARTQVLDGGFGTTDLIGTEASLLQKWHSRIFGR